MAFTYDSATTLGKVRLQVGDTDSTAALFTDAEVQVYLDQRADNILQTAADLCEVLATRFSREFDFETDRQKFSRSQRQKMYAEMAATLRVRAGGGVQSVASTRIDGYSSDIDSEATSSSASASGGRVRAGYFDGDLPY